MSKPKRHHWWPQLQSRHWTNPEGNINVIRRDGTVFAANPKNIGVMSQLYSRVDAHGNVNTDIEEWFSKEIESPFCPTLEHIISLPKKTTVPALNSPEKRR